MTIRQSNFGLLVGILLAASSVSAQNLYERNLNYLPQSTARAAVFQNTSLFTVGSRDACERPYLVKLGQGGDTIFTRTWELTAGSFGALHTVQPLGSNFLAAGAIRSTDTGPSTGVLIWFNANGDTVRTARSTSLSTGQHVFERTAASPTSVLALDGTSDAFVYHRDGSPKLRWPSSGGTLYDVQYRLGFYYFACDSGVVRVDTAFTSSTIVYRKTGIRGIQWRTAGSWIAFAADRIFWLNAGFNPVTSSSTSTKRYIHASRQGSRLFALYEIPGSRYQVLELNGNAVTQTKLLLANKDQALGIALRSNRLALVGTTDRQTNGFAKLYDLGLNESTFIIDAALTQYRLDSFRIDPPSPGCPNPLSANVTVWTTAVVSNPGTERINRIHIKGFDANQTAGCSGPNILAEIAVSIDPGFTESIPLTFAYTCQEAGTGTNYFLDQCIWISDPNGKLDKKHSNDSLCLQELLVPAGTSELFDRSVSFGAFPNPAHNTLTLASHTAIELFVWDITGKHMWTGQVNGQTSVDISTWKPGFYFISSSSRSGVKAPVQKLIVY